MFLFKKIIIIFLKIKKVDLDNDSLLNTYYNLIFILNLFKEI